MPSRRYTRSIRNNNKYFKTCLSKIQRHQLFSQKIMDSHRQLNLLTVPLGLNFLNCSTFSPWRRLSFRALGEFLDVASWLQSLSVSFRLAEGSEEGVIHWLLTLFEPFVGTEASFDIRCICFMCMIYTILDTCILQQNSYNEEQPVQFHSIFVRNLFLSCINISYKIRPHYLYRKECQFQCQKEKRMLVLYFET